MEEFSLPSVVGEESLSNTLHSKVELFDDCIHMILHFPPSDRDVAKGNEQEIDFIISHDVLITVHYESIYPIDQFAKLFEKTINHQKHALHGGLLFVQLMKQIYQHSLHKLDAITKTIQEIEYYIFNGKEDMMVKKISYTGRKLLGFKQALRFHHDILRSYDTASTRLFGQDYGYHASIVLSEFNKTNSLLESNRDALAELQRTNDSLLSTKTNDIMRTFTIMTFVMMPLTIITGVFGMNTSMSLIFIQDRADFFFVLGAMIFTGLTMFLFFKIRKWL